jgi:glutamate/tyrosine decarboxylase-like PLP-dependent enzyme
VSERPPPFRDLDWDPERAEAFAEEIIGVWTELLRSLRDGPVVAPHLTQEAVREAVAADVPEEPMATEELVEHLRTMLDHSLKAGHPAHLSYITGAGTVPGAAADLLASGLNPNVGGWLLSPAATEIEVQLTRWFAGQLGLPERSGGLIVAGGAIANFIALKCARDAVAGLDVRRQGIGARRLALYCSTEAHVTIDRAADMLGLGTGSVRHIAVDDGLRMQPEALEQAIYRDVEEGIEPVAVAATVGTTGTGAIDPLPELAQIASEHWIWFHVDAAYGGPAVLADDLRPLFAGIERADSITLDPHKWLSTPLGSGCVLVRDLQKLADSFGVSASYVHEEDVASRGDNLGFLGPQFSRGFDALKVWVSLLAHGRAAYARRISHDVELTRYLAKRVEEHPEFELVATGLSICCFRYRLKGVADEDYLDRLNERLMTELQLDGRVYPSNAIVHGRFCLRTCIVNFRTEAEDLDRLLEVAAELGSKLHAGESSTLPS